MAGLHRQESKFLAGYRLITPTRLTHYLVVSPGLQAEPDEPQGIQEPVRPLSRHDLSELLQRPANEVWALK